MIAIGRATGGRIPLSPIALATEGRIYLGFDGKHYPDKKRLRGIRVDREAVKAATEQVERLIEGRLFDIEQPKHINKVDYVLTKAIHELDHDQELIALLRLDEIKRHRELERLYAIEERNFEEELALFLLLIED